MSVLSERITLRLDALGHPAPSGGQSWLAREVGMKPQGIQSILNGDSKRPRKLREIAAALETSQEYLLGETDDPHVGPRRIPTHEWDPMSPPAIDPDAQSSVSSIHGARGVPKGATPEIDVSVGLGAGGAALVVSGSGELEWSADVVRDWWRLPPWFTETLSCPPEHIMAMRTRGESMEPRVLSGDIVFVDTRQHVPSPPGLYAIGDDFGGVMLKRLEVVSRPGEEPILVKVSSANPQYETQTWPIEDLRIVGRFLARMTLF